MGECRASFPPIEALHFPRKANQQHMAKDKEDKVVDDRRARFDALLEDYAKRNPEKYALKKARGEFDKIPDDFK